MQSKTDGFAGWLTVQELGYAASAVSIGIHPAAVLLVVPEVALVAVAVGPGKDPAAVLLAVPPLALVAVAVGTGPDPATGLFAVPVLANITTAVGSPNMSVGAQWAACLRSTMGITVSAEYTHWLNGYTGGVWVGSIRSGENTHTPHNHTTVSTATARNGW